MRSLFLVLCFISSFAHANTQTEFVGIRPAKEGVDLVFKNKADKVVLHDDDGLATLATMQRIYADTYLKASVEDRAKWTEGVPHTEGTSVKKIFTGALTSALKAYGANAENADHAATVTKLKEIEKAITDAGTKALPKTVLDKIGELLDESLENHDYNVTVGTKKYREVSLVGKPFDELFLHGLFADRLPAFKLADSVEGSKALVALEPDVKKIAVEYASLSAPSKRNPLKPMPLPPAPPTHASR